MLLETVSILLIQTWSFLINTIWCFVRLFLKSRPPGRQTVSYIIRCFLNPFLQVVTDLICFATLIGNLNVTMTSIVMILRITFGPLPCMFVATFCLIWQVSLIIGMGCVNYIYLIHLSIAHQWSWVHDWQAFSIHVVGSLVVFFHVLGVVGPDVYRVN